MKWFVLFFAVLVGMTTSDLVGLNPDMWQYWANVFTITITGSILPFVMGDDQ